MKCIAPSLPFASSSHWTLGMARVVSFNSAAVVTLPTGDDTERSRASIFCFHTLLPVSCHALPPGNQRLLSSATPADQSRPDPHPQRRWLRSQARLLRQHPSGIKGAVEPVLQPQAHSCKDQHCGSLAAALKGHQTKHRNYPGSQDVGPGGHLSGHEGPQGSHAS